MGVGALWRVSAVWDVGGVSRPMVNVFHYRQATADVVSPNAEDVFNAFNEEALPFIVPCLSDSIVCNLVQVRGISDPTLGGDFAVSPGIAGTLTGQGYALQANPLIKWTTGLIGRHYQGHNWLPPAVESVVDGAGSVSSAYRLLLEDAATGIMTLPVSGTHAAYDLIIYSAANPDADPPWGGAATVVTNYSIAPWLKTQRRRGL